jgi:hypothetical protein
VFTDCEPFAFSGGREVFVATDETLTVTASAAAA